MLHPSSALHNLTLLFWQDALHSTIRLTRTTPSASAKSQVQQHSSKQMHHQEKIVYHHVTTFNRFGCSHIMSHTAPALFAHSTSSTYAPLTPLSSSSHSASTPLLLCSHAALKLQLPHLLAAQPEWLAPIKKFYTACLASGAAQLKDKGFI